jgi:hypothetical protein
MTKAVVPVNRFIVEVHIQRLGHTDEERHPDKEFKGNEPEKYVLRTNASQISLQ